MKKNKYIPSAPLLGLLCLGLATCSKSDAPADSAIVYPLEVRATALEQQDRVRLFTKDGEVMDEAVIEKFIAYPPTPITLSFNEEFEPSESDIITFITDSSAQFGYSAVYYRVKKTGENQLGFLTHFAIDPDYTNPYHKVLDSYYIGKFNEPLTSLPHQTGAAFKGTVLSVAEGGYRSFRLPVLLYYLKRNSTGTEGEVGRTSASANKLFNEFNPDFITRLGAHDTIAVQEHWVRYKTP